MDIDHYVTSFSWTLVFALPIFLAAHRFQETGWQLALAAMNVSVGNVGVTK